MRNILKVIDERVDKLKLHNSKNDHYLFLTNKEYEILKNSLMEIREATVLTYRGLFVRIKESKKKKTIPLFRIAGNRLK